MSSTDGVGTLPSFCQHRLDSLTHHIVVGTPHHSHPESLRRRSQSTRSFQDQPQKPSTPDHQVLHLIPRRTPKGCAQVGPIPKTSTPARIAVFSLFEPIPKTSTPARIAVFSLFESPRRTTSWRRPGESRWRRSSGS